MTAAESNETVRVRAECGLKYRTLCCLVASDSLQCRLSVCMHGACHVSSGPGAGDILASLAE